MSLFFLAAGELQLPLKGQNNFPNRNLFWIATETVSALGTSDTDHEVLLLQERKELFQIGFREPLVEGNLSERDGVFPCILGEVVHRHEPIAPLCREFHSSLTSIPSS